MCHGKWVKVDVLVRFGVLHIDEAAKIIFYDLLYIAGRFCSDLSYT